VSGARAVRARGEMVKIGDNRSRTGPRKIGDDQDGQSDDEQPLHDVPSATLEFPMVSARQSATPQITGQWVGPVGAAGRPKWGATSD